MERAVRAREPRVLEVEAQAARSGQRVVPDLEKFSWPQVWKGVRLPRSTPAPAGKGRKRRSSRSCGAERPQKERRRDKEYGMEDRVAEEGRRHRSRVVISDYSPSPKPTPSNRGSSSPPAQNFTKGPQHQARRHCQIPQGHRRGGRKG